MGLDVLQVLRLGAVDVARDVEVEVVLRSLDLGQRHHARVARDLDLPGEDVDDLVDVLARRRFLLPSLMKPLEASIMKMPLRACGVLLVEHDDAGGDAGAVEEVRRQADDALDVAAPDDLACGCAASALPRNSTPCGRMTAPLPVLLRDVRMWSRKA